MIRRIRGSNMLACIDKELRVVVPRAFADGRGVFLEACNRRDYEAAGIGHTFVQDNFSRSCQHSDFCTPDAERGVAWNDPQIGIAWPLPAGTTPLLSDRNRRYATLTGRPADDLPELDITRLTAVEQVWSAFAPEAVIHCAAMTTVDACETEPDRAYAVNARGLPPMPHWREALEAFARRQVEKESSPS